MVKILAQVAQAKWFSNFIVGVILLAGFLVGLETYPSVVEGNKGLLHALDQIILWIFVVEVVIKMGAEGSKPWRYFRDPWNIFDFTIVAVCFLPVESSFVAVLRLARILRVLKLVTAIPKLQMLVGALLKSIPSMGYVSLLLGILFYIYACMGVTLLGANDPVHFGNLQIAMLSLFRTVTLEDWTDLMYIAMYGCNNYGYDGMMAQCTAPSASPVGGALFFVSFVLLGTMIVLNLFIGVIMNGMDEAQKDQGFDEAAKNAKSVESQIIILETNLTKVHENIDTLKKQIEKDKKAA